MRRMTFVLIYNCNDNSHVDVGFVPHTKSITHYLPNHTSVGIIIIIIRSVYRNMTTDSATRDFHRAF